MLLRDTKYCKGCKTRKPQSEFYKHSENYLSSVCKVCQDARNEQWGKENPERKKELSHKASVKYFYGISAKVYDSKLLAQGCKCAICGVSIKGKNAHLDHSHKTGKLRDFLCSDCNHGIGNFRDSPNLLRQAVLYLEKHSDV